MLIVTRVDFHRPDPGGIINSCILESSDSFVLKVSQKDKFDINLDVMAGNFFGISSRVNSPAL